jgi:hypothetical protein
MPSPEQWRFPQLARRVVVVVVVEVPGGGSGLGDSSVVVVLSVVVVTRPEPQAAKKAVAVRSAAPARSGRRDLAFMASLQLRVFNGVLDAFTANASRLERRRRKSRTCLNVV